MVSAHPSDPLKLTLQLTSEADELQVRAESALGEAHHEAPLPAVDLLKGPTHVHFKLGIKIITGNNKTR